MGLEDDALLILSGMSATRRSTCVLSSSSSVSGAEA